MDLVGSSERDWQPELNRFRLGYDIVSPLSFYRCLSEDRFAHLHRYPANCNATTGKLEPAMAPAAFAERPLLLSFKGARYGVGELALPAAPRDRLPALHNGVDVVVTAYCAWTAVDCRDAQEYVWSGAQDERCQRDGLLASLYTFDQLATSSQFSIVIAGEGTHRYVSLSCDPSHSSAPTAKPLLTL